MAFKHRAAAGGMAVLARHPPVEQEFYPPAKGGGWFPAARVVIDTAIGRLQLLSVHLRPAVSDGGGLLSGHFTTPAIRAEEISTFHARLAPGLPTVVAGDFNEEEDGDAVRFLLGHGFASALRRYAPDQPTWHWPSLVGELHRLLDHVFYDGRLDVLSAEVREAGRSDHWPVIAVIKQR